MEDSKKKLIQDVYDEAAKQVLPEGWWIELMTQEEAGRQMGIPAINNPGAIDVYVVDPEGVAHIVNEHRGPVKQVHAERNLQRAHREHPNTE